jgi:hypothetical protein
MKIKVRDARRIEDAIFVTHVTCLLVRKRKKASLPKLYFDVAH